MSLSLPRTAARPTTVLLDSFALAHTEVGLDPGELSALAELTWTPAVVPGGVHDSLLQAGQIEHPYFDRNEGALGWIEDRDWWFRSTFTTDASRADDERLELVFRGLDTVVDIWLNGEFLGHHENMFRPAEFDITRLARPANDLLLRFSAPLAGLEPPAPAVELLGRLIQTVGAMVRPEDPGTPPTAPEPSVDHGSAHIGGMSTVLAQSTLRRKAVFSWGWDFGPRVPSIGIWREVELRRVRRAAISGHHIRTDAVDTATRRAQLTVRVEADTTIPGIELEAVVALTSPSGRSIQAVLPVQNGAAQGPLTVDDADLWWTHDLGDPALYDVAIELREAGEICDTLTDRVGLRTISIDRSDDPEGGRLFRFILNGVPIFARGAAWLPASMMVGSVPVERYRDLVGLARSGNMTMLRIWGGGIYEHEEFYRATDEFGILVWHDFMFACVDYPSADPALQREVALEAEYQVKRLRNRASMALWAGNNEVQLIHGYAYQNYEPGNWGWDFFHRILPDTVARFDGGVPYWPGSPWGEDTDEGFMAVNGVRDGDRHAWEVWHGFDVGAGGGDYATIGESRHYRRYANDRGKFISEFGIHASPALSTLERWIPHSELFVHSASFDAHNKDEPKNKGDALLEIITGLPTTMSEYVDFTMISQAEGLKFGIEHYRRRQPHCSGALIWQFNDVWPGFSWSVVDFETVPKAGYYAAKRAYSSVLASFTRDGDRLALWVTNSTAKRIETVAEIGLGRFGSGRVESVSVPVVLDAGASREVWSAAAVAQRGADVYAWVESSDGAFPANRWFPAEVKDLPLPRPVLEVAATRTGPHSAEIEVRSDAFAYFVTLTPPIPTARLSDNYLDLRPGGMSTIAVTGLPKGFALEGFTLSSFTTPPQPVPARGAVLTLDPISPKENTR